MHWHGLAVSLLEAGALSSLQHVEQRKPRAASMQPLAASRAKHAFHLPFFARRFELWRSMAFRRRKVSKLGVLHRDEMLICGEFRRGSFEGHLPDKSISGLLDSLVLLPPTTPVS